MLRWKAIYSGLWRRPRPKREIVDLVSNGGGRLDYSPYVATHDVSGQQDFAHHAFFGGRIELNMIGKHVGDLDGEDVTSAYPYIQSGLPAMVIPKYHDAFRTKVDWKNSTKGKWTYLQGGEIDRAAIEKMSPYSMIELKFSFLTKATDGEGRIRDTPFYPLPYRTADGAVLFPSRGWGRYHVVEVLEAFNYIDVMHAKALPQCRANMITIVGGWVFEPPTDEKGERVYPYRYLKDFYEERSKIEREIKISGVYDVREKVIKLGINSAYGKMAQGVGGTKQRAPRTANPWVAGAITAGIRAMVLRRALAGPWKVVLFATDGMHSLPNPRDQPSDPEPGAGGKTFGGWDRSVIKAGIWVMPGVYAFSHVKRDETKFTGKSRGMSIGSILGDPEEGETEDRGERLYNFYDNNLVPLWAAGGGGKLTVPQERYITFGFATSSAANWRLAGCWVETTREIDADSGGSKKQRCSNRRRANGLVPLIVRPNPTPDVLSAPHVPEWLDAEARTESQWDEDMNEIAAVRGADYDDLSPGDDVEF
jgi:hypothetical protein